MFDQDILFQESTLIRDIRDLLNDVRSFSQNSKFGKSKVKSSIAKESKSTSLVFPVLCSSAISITAASLLSKALERTFAGMLQTIFNNASVTSAEDAKTYLRGFHINLGDEGNVSIDNFLSIIDTIETGAKHENTIMYNYDKADTYATRVVASIMNEIKNDSVLQSNINEVSVNCYKFKKDYYGKSYVMKEDPTYTNLSEAPNASTVDSTVAKNAIEVINKQLVNTDIKKANEMMPTLMAVVVTIKSDNNKNITKTFVFGIKARLTIIDSMEIVSKFTEKYFNGNALLNLIKATTKEISFWKDFIFAIDKMKDDAVAEGKGGSPNAKLWRLLERRRALKKWNKNILSIATIIISQEEVEYLKKISNIDIEDPATALKLVDGYGLLGLCIADEASEVAKIIYDGELAFEQIAFTQLERDNTNNAGKIMSLVKNTMRTI